MGFSFNKSALDDFKKKEVCIGWILYLFLTLVLYYFIWNLWAAISFSLAAYAVIWNDAVQTLMTFINSNNDINWKILFALAWVLMLWVLWYWYLAHGWDITYWRLDAKWYVDIDIKWYIPLFPLLLVFLTRFIWIPVSTSLLMLSIFSWTLLFEKILTKSALWYGVSFLSAFVVYVVVESFISKIKIKFNDKESRKSIYLRSLQFLTTGLLFWTWLMHDMVNIAVFLQDPITLPVMITISLLFMLGLFYTFYINWWPVGDIVTNKTTTNEILSATLIDFIYFLILLYFKELNDIPMSTTWVFVWLLAWRQFGIRVVNRIDKVKKWSRMMVALRESANDFWKLMIWLWISLVALVIVRSLTWT